MGSCASANSVEDTPNDEGRVDGFADGFFHGLTIFFALVASSCADVGIYEVHNNGIWYDIGYLIGVSLAGLLTLLVLFSD